MEVFLSCRPPSPQYQLLASVGATPTHAGVHEAVAASSPTSHLSFSTIDRLNGYLKNISNAATSEHSTLVQLIESNASLTWSYEALTVAYTALTKKAVKAQQGRDQTRTHLLCQWLLLVTWLLSSLTCNYKNHGNLDGMTHTNTMNDNTVNKGWGSVGTALSAEKHNNENPLMFTTSLPLSLSNLNAPSSQFPAHSCSGNQCHGGIPQ